MFRMKNRGLILLLALAIIFTSLPLPAFAEPEKVNITFTDEDGLTQEVVQVKVGELATIPTIFNPKEGELIKSVTNDDGEKINTETYPVTKDETFTIEYGTSIDVTFSIVGDKKLNNLNNQLVPPTKITITADMFKDLKSIVPKIGENENNQPVCANGLYAALKLNSTLEQELEDGRLFTEMNEGYIKKMFGLTELAPGLDKSGWMYFVNHKYARWGLSEFKIYDGDYIRWFYVENYKNNSYSWFDKKEAEVKTGEELDLELSYSKFDVETEETEFGKYEGATILVDDQEVIKDGQPLKTGPGGKVKLTFNTSGEHTVTAIARDENGLLLLTSPFIKVNVTPGEIDLTEIETWARQKRDLIAEDYAAQEELSDWWKIAEIGKLGKEINQKTKAWIKTKAIDSEGNLISDTGALLKNILAIRAARIDPEKYYGKDLVAALKAKDFTNSIWTLAPAVSALNSDDYTDATTKLNAEITKILNQQSAEGLWGGEWWQDSTGSALYALAPFYNTRADVKAAVEKAVDGISAKQLPNGDISADPGNANSLAMVVGGLLSNNPSYLKDGRLVKNGNTLLHALKAYDIEGTPSFTWKKDNIKFNDMATEQSFRALVTYFTSKEQGSTVFDYRGTPKEAIDEEVANYDITINLIPADATLKVTKKGDTEEISPVNEVYKLEAGDYTVTASKTGYITKTEDFTVTNEAKTINITLEENQQLVGQGTLEEPYLLKNQGDLEIIKKNVNTDKVDYKDKHFKITNDIELPQDWTPLGTNAKTNYFAGNIDGGNHTLTVPINGKPLLGAVSYASIKNMNIQGEKINGYGLVDGYAVGPYGAPAINIDNVTIKSGTNIVKSGFIGGYASGSNAVNISNSTVESGVVIGVDKDQDKVGSFAGDFNGTIVNCKSAATVYGKKYVGGIVSTKGQSMGPFEIKNCEFTGKVEATGEYVGGIVGGGYDGGQFGPALNTPAVTISNCYARGNIQGKNNVGGIFGGEPELVQCWDNGVGRIQNNYFSGQVTATDGSNIGGIIGYMNSLNRYNIITNNYFNNNVRSNRGIGSIKYIDTNYEDPQVTSGTEYFDSSKGANQIPGATKANHNRTDDPLGKDAEKLTKSVTSIELNNGSVVQALNNGADSLKNWVQDGDYPVHGEEVVQQDVTINVTPADAKFEVKNKIGTIIEPTNGVYKLVSGDYTVTASKEGYLEETEEFTVTDSPETVEINLQEDLEAFEVKVSVTPADATLKVTKKGDTQEIAPVADKTYMLETGDYTLIASKTGYPESKKDFTITEDTSTHTVEISLLAITSVTLEPNTAEITNGSEFTLPSKATATMSDNTTKEVDVTWDKAPDVNTLGTQEFTGTVEGWSGNLTFTLTVKEEVPVSIVLSNLEAGYYSSNPTLDITFNVLTQGNIPEGYSLNVILNSEKIEGQDPDIYNATIKQGMNILDINIINADGEELKDADGKRIFERKVFNLNSIKVVEFKPAPGQFVNTSWTKLDPTRIKENSTGAGLTLGGYGGYLVVDMLENVKNNSENPYGVDFTVFGNAFKVGSGTPPTFNQEPAAVFVMKDENNNGIADDTWYELAGSRANEEDTIRNYSVTYVNPKKEVAADVPWTDSLGGSGAIKANSHHKQPYYPNNEDFPNVNIDQETYTGTAILNNATGSEITSSGKYQVRFGYAETHAKVSGFNNFYLPDNPYTPNTQEGIGGDAFDISWAIDSSGNPVNLDEIRFVKVVTAINKDAGGMGELSPEITGVTRTKKIQEEIDSLKIDSEIERNTMMVTDRGFLQPVGTKDGSPGIYGEIHWTSDNEEVAKVNKYTGEVTALKPGVANITLSSAANPQLKDTVEITVIEKVDLIPNIKIIYEAERRNSTGEGIIFFTPEVHDQFGNPITKYDNKEFLWESLTPEIATVTGLGIKGMAKGQKEGIGRLKLTFRGVSVEVPMLVFPKSSYVETPSGTSPKIKDLKTALDQDYDKIVIAPLNKTAPNIDESLLLNQEALTEIKNESKDLNIQGKRYELLVKNENLKAYEEESLSMSVTGLSDDLKESAKNALGDKELKTEIFKFTSPIATKGALKLVEGQYQDADSSEYIVAKYNSVENKWYKVPFELSPDKMSLFFDVENDGIYAVVKGDLPLEVILYKAIFNVKDEDNKDIENKTIEVKKGEDVVNDITKLEPGNYTYKVTSEGYDEATGEFEITNSDKTVEVVMKKAAATITNVTLEPNVAEITQGESFTLPTKATATMSDNTTKEVDIAWDKEVDVNEVGTQTFTGTVEGWNDNLTFTLTVKAQPVTITNVTLEPNAAEITQGESFTLPTKATATMSDNTTKEVDIAWDKAPEVNTVGTQTFTGTVEGWNESLTFTLTVKAKPVTITNVTLTPNVAEITQGESFTLPTKATATMSDNTTKEVEVTWDKAPEVNEVGTQEFTGTVEGWSGSLTFTLTVTPEEQEIDKAQLSAQVEEAEQLLEEDYTPESWAPFKEALEAAKKVLEDAEATQEEVNESYKALRRAKNNLKPQEQYYTITVVRGRADKTRAKAGEVVRITTNLANNRFARWNSNTPLENSTSPTTSFIMPEKDVYIEAQIKEVPGNNYVPSHPWEAPSTKPAESVTPKEEQKEVEQTITLKIGTKTYEKTLGASLTEKEMDVEPFIKDNRTMVPLRFVGEALGYEVSWEASTRTAILKNKDKEIRIPVDKDTFTVNGEEYKFDSRPVMKNNRTMLAISNIAKALGLKEGTDIIWNDKTREVTIKVKVNLPK